MVEPHAASRPEESAARLASLFEMPDRALGMVWLDGRTLEAETAEPQPAR